MTLILLAATAAIVGAALVMRSHTAPAYRQRVAGVEVVLVLAAIAVALAVASIAVALA